MSYLTEAFQPLLSQNKQLHNQDIFKDEWYSYEVERNSKNDTMKLNTMVPSLNELRFKLKKPIKDCKKYNSFLFSSFFTEWSERDLLICILLFQLLLLVMIALK